MRPRGRPAALFFFFNDTATTEIYTLSLHDALPISATEGKLLLLDLAHPVADAANGILTDVTAAAVDAKLRALEQDRKSTRLNSSHANISYAVFCLKKKKPARLPPAPRATGDPPHHG